MKPAPLVEIVEYLDRVLALSPRDDKEGNGLAVSAGETVSKLGAALNTTFHTIRQSMEAGVDFLVVHHTSWRDLDFHLADQKLSLLRSEGVSLYAAHESLDRAPVLGTGDTLAQILGLTIEGRFADGFGVYGRFREESFEALVALAERQLDGPITSWRKNDRFEKGSLTTGGGGLTGFIDEARAYGCDTYVTGEGSMYSPLFARETGMNLLLGSHYGTESPGVISLTEEIASEFSLPYVVIEGDKGIR